MALKSVPLELVVDEAVGTAVDLGVELVVEEVVVLVEMVEMVERGGGG